MVIKLSIERDDELFRLERLSRVSCFLAKEFASKGEPLIISELEDHKGELTVTWTKEPNEKQKSIAIRGWELENEYSIVHKIL
ncbi:hypothetical protein [Bacteroides ihuae]|uniref:hypothetical protein n=1 Tax=Bacteroides ihuae TaxID=1852362 RepID=UPI0008D9779F|nr:hypothetical protein [Bacteroides ihuae]